MNRIEAKLRADGAAWRREVEGVDTGGEATPLRRSRPTRWVAPAAASATLVAVTLLAVLITHRAQPHDRGRTAGAATSSPTPSLPSGTLSGSADPLSPALAHPGAKPLHRVTAAEAGGMGGTPWQFAGIDATGTVITLTWVPGNCVRFGYELDETATDIRVQVLVAPATLPSGMVCASNLVQGVGTITLRQPLGDRRLLHAATG